MSDDCTRCKGMRLEAYRELSPAAIEAAETAGAACMLCAGLARWEVQSRVYLLREVSTEALTAVLCERGFEFHFIGSGTPC